MALPIRCSIPTNAGLTETTEVGRALIRAGNMGEIGAVLMPVKPIDEDYTVEDIDGVLHVTTAAGPITITLPRWPEDGHVLRIKKITSNANTLTVDGNGYLIDGSLSTWGTGATIDLVEFHLQYVAGSGWWSR